MAQIHITKSAAAQRQLDAAIRILFSEEDALAIHTIAAAAHRILIDLAKKHPKTPLDDSYLRAMKTVHDHFLPGSPNTWDLDEFKALVRGPWTRAANFLKHADRDAQKALNPEVLKTDHLLLQACALYKELGFEPTAEMYAFCRWHLAVYPHEENDPINTDEGPVHQLERFLQLRVGAFLVDRALGTLSSDK